MSDTPQTPPAGWTPQPPYAYPYPPGYAPVVMPTRTNGLAIASMVLGIVWIYWIGSILAIVFGFIARKQIRDSNGTQTGGGMATAGLVLGWIGVGFLTLAILIAFAVGDDPAYY